LHFIERFPFGFALKTAQKRVFCAGVPLESLPAAQSTSCIEQQQYGSITESPNHRIHESGGNKIQFGRIAFVWDFSVDRRWIF